MRCPYCGADESKVIDSRPTEDGEKIRRRRECLSCKKRFTTYEIVETVPLMVIKKDRSREVFDRQKLLNGMLRACEKRPVSYEQLDAAVSRIEQVLLGCKQYVSATAGSLRAQVQSAYAQTLTQQYPQAQQAFRQAARSARQASKKLGLLVRRNALDRMNETMAVLPQYANPENQADLAVEAARVLAQIDQLEQCFTGTF